MELVQTDQRHFVHSERCIYIDTSTFRGSRSRRMADAGNQSVPRWLKSFPVSSTTNRAY